MQHRIEITARVLPAGSYAGNDGQRLLFSGELWDDWDLEFCIHGEKLRWKCDSCEEYFQTQGLIAPK